MRSLNITHGIKILSDYDIQNRVFLNSGTRFSDFTVVVDKSLNPLKFQGFVPKEDWRNCNAVEMKYLFSKSKLLQNSEYIRISRIPDTLFQDKGLLRLNAKEHFSKNLRESFAQNITFQIKQYICKSFSNQALTHDFGLRFIDNINLPTITFDENINLFIGLHIDCWDNAHYSIKTHNIRNRICLNLGQGPRCFLFINLSLKQLVYKLRFMDKIEKSKHAIVHNFCKFFPDYPVVKIILLPGEYYVAPTENIIHDATIPKDSLEDISMTILGHFR